MVKYENPEAIDLLRQMIVFNPQKRIPIEQALDHPYLSSIKENMVDPVFSGSLNFSFE